MCYTKKTLKKVTRKLAIAEKSSIYKTELVHFLINIRSHQSLVLPQKQFKKLLLNKAYDREFFIKSQIVSHFPRVCKQPDHYCGRDFSYKPVSADSLPF